MRIVINGWFWEQIATGSGQYLASLAAWLAQAGPEHERIMVTPRGQKSSALTAGRGWQTVAAPTPFDGLSRNLAKLWFEQVAFPRACRRLHADVALVPYWGSPWWQPCPTVVTVHDVIPLLLPLYRGSPLQRAYTALVSRTARRAHAVLADSEAGRRDIIARLNIPPERVHAIHLAVDPGFSPVTDGEKLARVREKYALPDEAFLLYMGGFDARKNVARMLQGYAQVVKSETAHIHSVLSRGTGQGQETKLVVAGKLPGKDSAFMPDPAALAERLGIRDRVSFIGWVDEADKPALYSMALAALYLSAYEGFGLPVLEAMGCGCAVITASSPGMA